MEKSPMSLRRLPARSAKSAERSRKIYDVERYSPPPIDSPRRRGRKPKETEEVKVNVKTNSPSRRRSRSRSTARRRPETVNNVLQSQEREVATPEKMRTRQSSRIASSPAIVNKIKESVDKIRASVSPDLENVIRKSVSRFEEVTSEIVTSVVTRRGSSRASSLAATVNSTTSGVNTEAVIQEEVTEEKEIITNHTNNSFKEKLYSSDEKKNNSINYLVVATQLLLGLFMCAFVVVSHIICNKDDCRLLTSNLLKVVDYTEYFNSIVWSISSLTSFLLFVGSHFVAKKQKKAPHISIVGVVSGLVFLASIFACHYYNDALRSLEISPLITAIIAHTLVLIAYLGTSNSKDCETVTNLLSSMLTLLLNVWIVSVEMSRTTPNSLVLTLSACQAFLGLDNLFIPQLFLGLGPIQIIWKSLRPLVFILPQVYISANNLSLELYAKIVIVTFFTIGYIIYRYSSTVKTSFLRDPYSQKFSKSTNCGDYSAGIWGTVRHPQMLGLLICEVSLACATLSLVVAPIMIALSFVSSLVASHTADHLLSRSYKSKVTSSIIPFFPR